MRDSIPLRSIPPLSRTASDSSAYVLTRQPDPHLREIGRDMKTIALQTLRSLGVWHCRKSGMEEREFEELLVGCEREISDTNLRLYIQL